MIKQPTITRPPVERLYFCPHGHLRTSCSEVPVVEQSATWARHKYSAQDYDYMIARTCNGTRIPTRAICGAKVQVVTDPAALAAYLFGGEEAAIPMLKQYPWLDQVK